MVLCIPLQPDLSHLLTSNIVAVPISYFLCLSVIVGMLGQPKEFHHTQRVKGGITHAIRQNKG